MSESADDKKNTDGTTATLEMDGKIFYVERDADGNVLSREELDGEVMLAALLHVIEKAVYLATTEKTEEIV